MKKFTIYTLPLLAMAVTGCGGDSSGDDPKPNVPDGTKVTIATTVQTRATCVTELTAGQEMNVFVKSYSSIDAANLRDNVKGTLGNDGIWTLSPEIYLDEKQQYAYFLAAYPFVSGANPKEYPVDLTQQKDVLYSGSIVTATRQTTTARLTMKHALSMLSFEIDASSYTGTGTLSSLTVSGQEIYSAGKLNVQTGAIDVKSSQPAPVSATMSYDIKQPRTGTANIWVIPFSSKVNAVTLEAIIDGKNYVLELPEVTTKIGYQYCFHLVLTPNGMTARPDVIDEISLNVEGNDIEAAPGYGMIKLTTTAQSFKFPVFEGTNVFGTVVASGVSTGYKLDGSVTLASSPATVTIETWNSTGVSIETISDITAIDLSQY